MRRRVKKLGARAAHISVSAATMVALAIVLLGCQSNPPPFTTTGVVYDKAISDPNTDGTTWSISISSPYNGGTIDLHFSVTQSSYDSVNVGDSVSCTDPRDGSLSVCQ